MTLTYRYKGFVTFHRYQKVVTWAVRRFWGTIVILRQRTIIKNDPIVKKKKLTNRTPFFKILERLLKKRMWNERKLVEKNVKMRNAFLSLGTEPGCKGPPTRGGGGANLILHLKIIKKNRILYFEGCTFKAFITFFFKIIL